MNKLAPFVLAVTGLFGTVANADYTAVLTTRSNGSDTTLNTTIINNVKVPQTCKTIAYVATIFGDSGKWKNSSANVSCIDNDSNTIPKAYACTSNKGCFEINLSQ